MTEVLEFHPLADLFPLIQGQEFDDLVTDIRAFGVREPIMLFDGKVLDGRNRYRACVEAGVETPTVAFGGDDPAAYVISLNLRRRHMNESQRAMVAARLANLREGRPSRTTSIDVVSPAVSQPHAAALLNVSLPSVQRAAAVQRDATPTLAAAVDAGKISVSAAADVSSLPQAEQETIVAKGEREILEAAKQIRSLKATARKAENDRLKAEAPPIPAGRFSTIVIDPPWEMAKIERDVRPNQVAFDYPTMSEQELMGFGVEQMADDNAHIFCWTTQKHLPSALRLVEAWGFRYVLTMVWHKAGGFQPIGLPQYNCEFVVYGRRGSPSFVDTKAFPCCFEAPRREHSRKPDEFYETIRRVAPGPRIDVFSREARDGFDQFGNEVSKFGSAA